MSVACGHIGSVLWNQCQAKRNLGKDALTKGKLHDIGAGLEASLKKLLSFGSSLWVSRMYSSH
jgi:hypothetical protein